MEIQFQGEEGTWKSHLRWYFKSRGPLIFFVAVVAVVVSIDTKYQITRTIISWWGQ